jgi:hypothetical protein
MVPIGAALAPLTLVPLLWIGGDRRNPATPKAVAAPPERPATRSEPFEPPRESARIEQVVESQKKRIMGRKKSLEHVRRVAREVGPLVERALEQPAIQTDLRALAEEMGLTLPAYKRYFKGKQEADLLLESGGDPNARSVANAIGVAQWLASTGRAQGLRVDAAASRQLTLKIDRLQAEIEALRAQPATFTRSAPAWWTPRVAATHGDREMAAGEMAKASDPSRPAPGTGASAPVVAPEVAAATNTPAPAQTTGLSPDAASEPAKSPVEPAGAGETAGTTTTAAGENPVPAAGTPPGPTATRAPARDPAPTLLPHPWTRDQWIYYRNIELKPLLAKRRSVDERYDPAKAIAVQTRYLVQLARRYGSLDWALQAYHGGEGGVARTVAYYLGDRRAQFASTEGAIRGVLASRGGAVTRVRPHLTYADFYFGITPRTHPQAFGYLFGRSDDHRYYWWKVLMAERAIALYRRDPKEFERQWQALRPGQRMEVAWHPRHEELAFRDVAALRRGYADGTLVRLPADLGARGIELGPIAPLDAANAYHYKGLRPESMGALLRVAGLYRRHGGRAALRVLSLMQTTQYSALLDARYPTPPPKEPVDPADLPIDLHPTGLTFDIQRPVSDWDRKVLEYALGILYDRSEISWLIERERGPSRYHITPNPAHARSLSQAVPGRKGT